MPLIVQKYGGTSLATPEKIKQVADRIAATRKAGNDLVVVVSAMGNMTDELEALAHKIVSRPAQREMDMLLTAGERVSMSLLSMALQERGVPAISFTGSQCGIVTTPDHTDAKILDIRPIRVTESLAQGKVVIIAGFQGVSVDKEITTLGRGGSDTTAVALAAALNADRCEILTDVDGLFTADPRVVPNAKLIEACSYDEAIEFASLGAKMHRRSLEIAKQKNVEILIQSSSDTSQRGTRIVDKSQYKIENTTIRGITSQKDLHLFSIEAGIKQVSEICTHLRIPIHSLNYFKKTTHVHCDNQNSNRLRDYLDELKLIYDEIFNISTVSLVGEGIFTHPTVLPQFSELLEKHCQDVFLVTANPLSVTGALPSSYREETVRRIHQYFLG